MYLFWFTRSTTIALIQRYDPILLGTHAHLAILLPRPRQPEIGMARPSRCDPKTTARNAHWPTFEVDLAIRDLMAGLLGTRSLMAHQAGRATSEDNANAARRNGAKGRRPRKAAEG
jgi:hypothetical protein